MNEFLLMLWIGFQVYALCDILMLIVGQDPSKFYDYPQEKWNELKSQVLANMGNTVPVWLAILFPVFPLIGILMNRSNRKFINDVDNHSQH